MKPDLVSRFFVDLVDRNRPADDWIRSAELEPLQTLRMALLALKSSGTPMSDSAVMHGILIGLCLPDASENPLFCELLLPEEEGDFE